MDSSEFIATLLLMGFTSEHGEPTQWGYMNNGATRISLWRDAVYMYAVHPAPPNVPHVPADRLSFEQALNFLTQENDL